MCCMGQGPRPFFELKLITGAATSDQAWSSTWQRHWVQEDRLGEGQFMGWASLEPLRFGDCHSSLGRQSAAGGTLSSTQAGLSSYFGPLKVSVS